MLPHGVKFTIFRGTVEYCSPEVHRGEGCFGPELDIWALGVTLFTIVFRENPFTVESGPYELTESDLPYPISDAVDVVVSVASVDDMYLCQDFQEEEEERRE
ncbi:hypothetical protein Btru_024036 [Bulinus truncatus]|nr:hypothetical protein Btru_024036 [Bulinus truncatus]